MNPGVARHGTGRAGFIASKLPLESPIELRASAARRGAQLGYTSTCLSLAATPSLFSAFRGQRADLCVKVRIGPAKGRGRSTNPLRQARDPIWPGTFEIRAHLGGITRTASRALQIAKLN